MSDMVDIPATEALYKDEWLLFEVTETDAQGQPLRGRLLVHEPDRAVIHRADLQSAVQCAYVTFAGPTLPDGYQAAL